MSEHTPTLWYSAGWDRDREAVEIRGFGAAILHGLYLGGTDQAHINANRAVACVNAFHSPDGRTIATEDIAPGVVFQLRDALNQMQNWACKFENMLEYESLKDEKQFGKEHSEARALLSSLKVQGPET